MIMEPIATSITYGIEEVEEDGSSWDKRRLRKEQRVDQGLDEAGQSFQTEVRSRPTQKRRVSTAEDETLTQETSLSSILYGGIPTGPSSSYARGHAVGLVVEGASGGEISSVPHRPAVNPFPLESPSRSASAPHPVLSETPSDTVVFSVEEGTAGRALPGGDAPTAALSSSFPFVSRHPCCRMDRCPRVPSYGRKGDKRGSYCAFHKLEGMVYVVSRPCCLEVGCERQPSFGFEGDKRASYCSRHKRSGMVDINTPRCKEPSCIRQPIFGQPGGKKPQYCGSHKEEGMVQLKTRARCRQEGCGRRPSFGREGEKATCCFSHKEPDMVDVTSARCNHQGCRRQRAFGWELDKKPVFCSTHKVEGMTYVMTRKRCEYPGCQTWPSFGNADKKGATHCTTHKLKGMVDTRNTTCIHPGCTSRPSFGHMGTDGHTGKGGGRAVYCTSHKLPGMVNIRHRKTTAAQASMSAFTSDALVPVEPNSSPPEGNVISI